MRVTRPRLTILGGPNGAGKTTLARSSYAYLLETDRFLNADAFAAELSSDAPSDKAVPAGRRLIELRKIWIDEGIDFIIESTLATKTLLRSVRIASAQNYRITLIFLWISDPDICIQRVADRVSQGGHYIPADVIKRRHARGLQLLPSYLAAADDADIIDANGSPKLIARRRADQWKIYDNKSLPHHLLSRA